MDAQTKFPILLNEEKECPEKERKKKERGEKGADCFESEKFLIDIVFCTFNFVDECAGLF